MNSITEKLIIALVVIPVLLIVFKGWKEAGAIAAAIAVALFFANIDKFQRFKGAGIEAELRTVVNEAYAAIEQLKELGLALSSPIVDELAISGRMFQFIHLKYKLENVANITATLKKLGASDAEIKETGSTLYKRVETDHVKAVVRTLKASNPDKAELFKQALEGNYEFQNKAWLDNFIKENSLVMNNDADEWVLDLDYFVKEKKLRREDKWQS